MLTGAPQARSRFGNSMRGLPRHASQRYDAPLPSPVVFPVRPKHAPMRRAQGSQGCVRLHVVTLSFRRLPRALSVRCAGAPSPNFSRPTPRMCFNNLVEHLCQPIPHRDQRLRESLLDANAAALRIAKAAQEPAPVKAVRWACDILGLLHKHPGTRGGTHMALRGLQRRKQTRQKRVQRLRQRARVYPPSGKGTCLPNNISL